MTPAPFSPVPGRNTPGLAKLTNNGSVPVTIEFVRSDGFFYCRDDAGRQHVVHQSDFVMTPQPPSRYRLYNWQALETFWSQAINAYPQAIVIPHGNISNETLARKLREARYAKDRYNHPSSIDAAKWKEITPKLYVTCCDNGTVTIGPEAAKYVTPFEAVVTSSNSVFIKWDNKKSTLEDFCALAHARAFEPKPVFIVLGLTDDLIADLESRYDVGFTPREDGKSWIVVF